jgi:hypothetical protein
LLGNETEDEKKLALLKWERKKKVNAGIGRLIGDLVTIITNGPYSGVVDSSNCIELDIDMTNNMNID